MVSCNNNLEPVWPLAQPMIEIDKLLWLVAEWGEISGMKE
jgi:hypothetical protein